MCAIIQTCRAWNSNLLGRCTELKHTLFPAQILQPLHLQLPLLHGQLPEPASLQWVSEVECDKFSRTDPLEGAMGEQHGSCQIVLPIHRSNVHGSLDGWLVFPHRSGFILVSSLGLVRIWHILYEESDRCLALVCTETKDSVKLSSSDDSKFVTYPCKSFSETFTASLIYILTVSV